LAPRFVASKVVYKGRRLNVERLTFTIGEDNNSHDVDVLNFEVPRSVAILPITETGNVILEKHYRYAPRKDILEIPAGWIEKGESPLEAARRELKEETGFSSRKVINLGTIIPASGYSTEQLFFFLARIKENSRANQRLEKGEEISVIIYPKDRILRMIKTGEIVDPMMICAVFRASLRGLY
jgi:ADP-ribose pyrophosphatase